MKRAQQTCCCGAYPFPHRWCGGKCRALHPWTPEDVKYGPDAGPPEYMGVDRSIVSADNRDRARDMNLAAKGR